MPAEFIRTTGDMLHLLDEFLDGQGSAWWDEFFADQARPIPFFTQWPDENLAEWFDRGLLAPGRVLLRPGLFAARGRQRLHRPPGL
jgi:hypothetical protein